MDATSGVETATDLHKLRRRQGIAVIGLLITLSGVAAIGVSLPIGTSALLRQLPVVGLGALLLWIGGTMMGLALGMKMRTARGR